MKPRFFIELNLIGILVFLIIFAIILYSVDPYKASSLVFIIFYLVLFGLLLSILNLIGFYLKIPFWVRVLIAITIIIVLILRKGKF